ncbi:MAG: hypothetical protein Q4C47_06345, partial [Planctomycetia bacterium]|nr:hypothetical protein [Planctomycetia bacterium]
MRYTAALPGIFMHTLRRLCIFVVLTVIATSCPAIAQAQRPLERLRPLPPPSDPSQVGPLVDQLRSLIPAIAGDMNRTRPGNGSVPGAVPGSWRERLRQVDPDDPGLNPDFLFPPDAAAHIPGFGPPAGWEPVPLSGTLKTDAVYAPDVGYGIGTVEFTLPGDKTEISVEEVGLSIHEVNGRIFYPSLEIRQIPREVTGSMQASGMPIVSLVGS